MNCEDARGELIELLDGVRRDWPPAGELQAHLAGCQVCQEWYEKQRRSILVLEQLEPLALPSNFKSRVLDKLPASPPRKKAVITAQAGVSRPQPGQERRSFWQGLTRPAARRRLAPALALVASLLLVAGLVYVLQGGQPPSTPGAATGSAGWVVAGGLAMVAVVLVVALFLHKHRR